MFLVADFFSDKHEVGVQLYNCTATVKRESYKKLIVWDNLCKEFDKITLHNTHTLILVRLWNCPKKQDFWPKINILKGNYCILRIGLMGTSEFLKNQSFKNQLFSFSHSPN